MWTRPVGRAGASTKPHERRQRPGLSSFPRVTRRCALTVTEVDWACVLAKMHHSPSRKSMVRKSRHSISDTTYHINSKSRDLDPCGCPLLTYTNFVARQTENKSDRRSPPFRLGSGIAPTGLPLPARPSPLDARSRSAWPRVFAMLSRRVSRTPYSRHSHQRVGHHECYLCLSGFRRRGNQ